ncbi:hypothetical protein GO497_10855 [Acidovorax citrulli]|nr:hypothetical protein [Paracidovorax citrulli]
MIADKLPRFAPTAPAENVLHLRKSLFENHMTRIDSAAIRPLASHRAPEHEPVPSSSQLQASPANANPLFPRGRTPSFGQTPSSAPGSHYRVCSPPGNIALETPGSVGSGGVQEVALNPVSDRLLKKSDMRPGDILLYVNPRIPLPLDAGIALGHYMGKKLQPEKNRGNHNIIHAALWTMSPKHAGEGNEQENQEPEVVEAHVGLSKKNHAVIGNVLTKGDYLVYRPKDVNLGDWASQIAMVWSSERKIPYSFGKVVKAGTKSMTAKGPQFDEAAHDRASAYMQQAFESDPLWKRKARSAPTLVLAAYQAALLNIQNARDEESGQERSSIEATLGQHVEFHVNASRTTPLNLHSLLQQGQAFEQIGKIRISGAA